MATIPDYLHNDVFVIRRASLCTVWLVNLLCFAWCLCSPIKWTKDSVNSSCYEPAEDL